jgi:hypothetical protein
VGLKGENVIRVGGWLLSLLCILTGSYFIWPHIHVALLGIVFLYLGVRVFNFSTFKEYAKKRQQLLLKLQKW